MALLPSCPSPRDWWLISMLHPMWGTSRLAPVKLCICEVFEVLLHWCCHSFPVFSTALGAIVKFLTFFNGAIITLAFHSAIITSLPFVWLFELQPVEAMSFLGLSGHHNPKFVWPQGLQFSTLLNCLSWNAWNFIYFIQDHGLACDNASSDHCRGFSDLASPSCRASLVVLPMVVIGPSKDTLLSLWAWMWHADYSLQQWVLTPLLNYSEVSFLQTFCTMMVRQLLTDQCHCQATLHWLTDNRCGWWYSVLLAAVWYHWPCRFGTVSPMAVGANDWKKDDPCPPWLLNRCLHSNLSNLWANCLLPRTIETKRRLPFITKEKGAYSRYTGNDGTN